MRIINNNISKWFIIIAIPVTIIWSYVVVTHALNEKKDLLERTIKSIQVDNMNTAKLIGKEFSEITENLKIIRDTKPFNLFLKDPSHKNYEEAVQLFARVVRNKSHYNQIRFINNDGTEVIRIDNNNGPVIANLDTLQNKSNRYYFSETIKLAFNEIYISYLDLNIENNEIELPIKPMLRFSTPVYDNEQHLRGILIINYLAKPLIDILKNNRGYLPHCDCSFYVLNEKGQFIIHPEEHKNFSFMFDKTNNLLFQQMHETLWNEMVSNNFIGYKMESDRLYSYYNVLENSATGNKKYDQCWTLVYSFDIRHLLSWHNLLGASFWAPNVIIFIVILLLSLLLAIIIDRLQQTDEQLDFSKQIAASTNDAIVIADKNMQVTYANKAYEEMIGFGPEEIIGYKVREFLFGNHDKEFYETMWSCINESEYWEGMLWNENKDGLLFPKKLKVIAIKDKRNNKIIRYVGIFSDLSTNKIKSDSLDVLKHYDGKIIIPNETMMIELLDQSVKNKNFNFTIMYLSIENFNRVVSLLGDDIRLVSEAFINLIRPLIEKGDIVAQTGRNLFAVIVEMDHITGNPELYLKNFHKKLSRVIEIDGQELFFKTRIGASSWPQDTNNIQKLLLNAMVALEWSTREQEVDIAFFNEGMIVKLDQENAIEGQLRNAIENNELSMVYQPQIDIATEKIIGMEALLRWNNSVLGNVSPTIFIPIAEKNNLIIDIGDWVIQAVCLDLKKLNENLFIRSLNLKCAVNVSTIQMEDMDFTERFFNFVAEHDIKSHQLEVEITESYLLSNEKKGREMLEGIRAQGFSIALDDFGTGYSSLSYLNNLPIDKMKIDRGFIKDYPENDDGTLIKILVEMSKTLKMNVLTEGAETKEQVDFLNSIGCDYIQGYYYSKPLPLASFISFVEANSI